MPDKEYVFIVCIRVWIIKSREKKKQAIAFNVPEIDSLQVKNKRRSIACYLYSYFLFQSTNTRVLTMSRNGGDPLTYKSKFSVSE